MSHRYHHGLSLIVAVTALACGAKNTPPSQGVTELSAGATAAPLAAKTAPKLDAKAETDRGLYLVNTSGCHDCHTPLKMGPAGPAPDMARALSGHPAELVLPPPPVLPEGPWLVSIAATNTAYAGPWGVSFTANLTSDAETGLGKWSRQNFIETIRNGRHMGAGRPLLPPMPSPVYANMTDEDLGAIYAYLQTVPALRNKVPAAVPPTAPQKKK